MKRLFIICFLTFSVCTSAQNEIISGLISHINEDSIAYNVKQLENFKTRFAFAENNKDVALYLQMRMQQYGFESTIDSFFVEQSHIYVDSVVFSGWQYNVLCLKKSSKELVSDTSVILGAHYDCISNIDGFKDYLHYAPGADDNASGVACLLELARVWNTYANEQKLNLRIEFYDCEEMNLAGSNDRLYKLSSPWTMFIPAMIDLDMVGSDSTNTVSINYYDNAHRITALAVNNTGLYTDLRLNMSQELIQRSDSWNFFAWGIPSLFISEHDFSPYYHSLRDSCSYLNYPYMAKITAITLSVVYDIVNEYRTVDLQDIQKDIVRFLPQNGKISVLSENKDSKDIIITNASGQCVFKKRMKGSNITVNTSNLTAGTYIITATKNNKQFSKKFFIKN